MDTSEFWSKIKLWSEEDTDKIFVHFRATEVKNTSSTDITDEEE